MLKNYPSIKFSLYAMPSICDPLVGQTISTYVEKYPHLLELKLVYFSGTCTNIQVDVLIGSDCVWECITGSIYRVVGGPAAIHTKLGWVLSGPSHDKLKLDYFDLYLTCAPC